MRSMADLIPKIFAWIDTSEKFDEEHGRCDTKDICLDRHIRKV